MESFLGIKFELLRHQRYSGNPKLSLLGPYEEINFLPPTSPRGRAKCVPFLVLNSSPGAHIKMAQASKIDPKMSLLEFEMVA